MTAADLIYSTRRALVLAERAKGPAKRIQERAEAQAAIDDWMIDNGIAPMRYITLAEFRRMYP